jgi:uncharacterized protein (DUF1800 family)
MNRSILGRLADGRTAWEPYEPSPAAPWNLQRVGHLFRRAAFGATHEQLQTALNEGPAKTLDRLLAGGPDQTEFYQKFDRLGDTVSAYNSDEQMRAWWLFALVNSPHPLREKMTLFWHNHFATSNAKVNHVGYMIRQNQLFRRHALGRFDIMLQEVSKDPAMLVWLDTIQSRKGKPNENYARELMELFSLGLGHYSEFDIREAAKAFTGWTLKNENFYFNPSEHDPSPKRVFGREGNYGGEDIVKLCLEKEASASFIVRKLYRAFISETQTPSDALIEPLAERFRRSRFDLHDLVGTMLRSRLFFSEAAYRARIKSPVEFALGLVRGLEGQVGTQSLAEALDNLGQRLFYPPSVKGWDGGENWLNGTTLLLRQNLALAMTSTEDARFGRRADPVRLAQKYGASDDAGVIDLFLRIFLQNDVPDPSRARLHEYAAKSRQQTFPAYWTPRDIAEHRIRTLAYLVVSMPEYQLD